MTRYKEVIQNRIHAASEDDAALKIRKKYGSGKLTLKHIFGDWYEFTIIIRTGKANVG